MAYLRVQCYGSGITSNISKFADDIKIGHTIRTGEDARALQEDLNKLSAWSNKWQMSFSINKCIVLSIGTRNPLHGYSLHSTAIGRTDCERDQGVLLNSDLKLRKHCISARNKANRVLDFLNRTVTNRSADLRLHLALVCHT